MEIKKTTNQTQPILGFHLLLDLHTEDQEAMGSMDKIIEFLNFLPDAIGMIPICEPKVVQFLQPPLVAWGISGFIMISESHISIHTFPNKAVDGFKGWIHADIFSCKEFNPKEVIGHFREWFSVIGVGELGNVQFIKR